MQEAALKAEVNYTERFNYLLCDVVRRGVPQLVAYLENNGFFTAPCSSQHHGCCDGGLVIHSVQVTDLMLKLRPVIAPEITEDSCIVSGLLHDIGKAGFYGKPNYIENILKKTGKRSDSKPFETNSDRLAIPHQVVSLQITSKFIPLTEDEAFAILYHNGLYTPDGRAIQGKETPLMMLLHFADMWSSRFVEGEYKPVSDGGLF